MTNSKPGYITPDAAETAFYEAFINCDLSTMKQLWAEVDVVCVHPGSGAITGYESIMSSWEYILDDTALPDIQINVLKQTMTDSLAVFVVEEYISTGENSAVVILATNVYQKFDGGWLMTEHHSSVIQPKSDRPTLQ